MGPPFLMIGGTGIAFGVYGTRTVIGLCPCPEILKKKQKNLVNPSEKYIFLPYASNYYH